MGIKVGDIVRAQRGYDGTYIGSVHEVDKDVVLGVSVKMGSILLSFDDSELTLATPWEVMMWRISHL